MNTWNFITTYHNKYFRYNFRNNDSYLVFNFKLITLGYSSTSGGTRWRSLLRHCTTRRKVAVSIPDGITGTFHWPNSSGQNMTLGSNQPLTEMSIRNIFWDKGGGYVGLKILPPFMCRMSRNSGNLNLLEPQRPVQSSRGIALPYLYVRQRYLHGISTKCSHVVEITDKKRKWSLYVPVILTQNKLRVGNLCVSHDSTIITDFFPQRQSIGFYNGDEVGLEKLFIWN
jgi:hypothetical protein